MTSEKHSQLMNFFLHVGQAKRTLRTGWVLRDINRAESIADHMYRMSLMSFLAPKELDRNKCIQMCLVHDLAECIVGDLTPMDNVPKEEKAAREKMAMASLANMIKEYDEEASALFSELYLEYEKHESNEAKYVKSLDLLDMYIQAYEYEKLNGKPLEDFFAGANSILNDEKDERVTPQVKQWIKEIVEIRNKGTNLLPPDSNMNTILKDYFVKNSNKNKNTENE